ncbi:MAG: sigma 54-interacting transcriptional regulator [Deltaproteobacteria bacterium]|nr:sigma 54-interacting transcriptional regulator [Deltaproteobacteria bacterium]MBW2723273.1 sigma 54-interacting transcriptional regulator [Deltaproteobacteria bacterium]
MTPDSPPAIARLGDLRTAGYGVRTLRDELRTNLQRFMREGRPIFAGIVGYEETVIPALENALLCGHDLIFLGERGQAKTRMIRAIVGLLDEWVPEIAGSEIHDDPFDPVSAFAREQIASRGDDTEIAWLHRDDRYGEKLATPDTSIADLIGDVDPIKVAEGHHLSDEYTLHFGLLPRTHRGIFCINELPDLTEKVQVGLFNVMEERDIQVKGYRVRLPIDVLVVASANPEDYTSRGRIITPLKDRYAAQIRTHYPKTRAIEVEVARQEANLPQVGETHIHVPDYMTEIVAELTFQARSSADISQASGVSVRMTIANFETLVANAQRRALALNEPEAVPRISDLPALLASSRGKIELEYAGAERNEDEILHELMQRAVRVVFEEVVQEEEVKPVVESFEQGWQVEVAASLPSSGYLDGLDEIAGLRSLAERLAGSDSEARLASAIEFVLEGLHLANRLNKDEVSGALRFGKLRAAP